MALTALLFLSFVALRLWPPRVVRRPARFKRTMDFLVVVGAYLVVGRVSGLIAGVAPVPFFTMECIGLSALALLEALYVGREHAWTALLPIVSIALMHYAPAYRVAYLNVLYVSLFGLSVYLHLRPRDAAASGAFCP